MLWPRTFAPPAIATATNTISRAYSVAVAPRSSRRKYLSKSDMQWVLGKWASRQAFRHPGGVQTTYCSINRRERKSSHKNFREIFRIATAGRAAQHDPQERDHPAKMPSICGRVAHQSARINRTHRFGCRKKISSEVF